MQIVDGAASNRYGHHVDCGVDDSSTLINLRREADAAAQDVPRPTKVVAS